MKPATSLLAPLALIATVLALAAPTRATVQDDDCIDPAVEYPLPCEDDED